MALPLDYYAQGKLIPRVGALTADRALVFPDADLDFSQLGSPISEGFESGSFPTSPTGAWSTPSVRYPTSTAWEVSASSPLVGSYSLATPATLADGTVYSVGLDVTLWEPGRVFWRWSVKGEENTDGLSFWVDGALVFKQSNGSGTSIGRWCTDVLPAGRHTIDYLFSKGPSGGVAGEGAQIDEVQVIPESRWLGPDYVCDRDDMLGSPNNRWSVLGSGSLQVPTTSAPGGALRPRANGNSVMAAERIPALWASLAAGPVVLEWRVRRVSTYSGYVIGVGAVNDYTTMNESVIAFISDQSPNATGTWWLASGAGSYAAQDTGLAAPTGTAWGNVRLIIGPESATVAIEGKAIQTVSGQRFSTSTVTSAAVRPLVRVRSADASVKDVDVQRYLWLGPR